MRKRILPTLISALLTLTFLSVKAMAQNVTDADFHQEGDKVAVTFHLDRSADIELYVSTDGGKTFRGPLSKVSGSAGGNVPSGRCRIIWDPVAEYGGITGDNVCFKIKASPGKNAGQKRTSPSGSRNSRTLKRHNKFLRFGMGIGLGGLMIEEQDKSVFTFSIPMELSLGRVDQRLNFAISETFSFLKNTIQITSAGIFRLRIFELMYIGAGGGLNVNLYTNPEGFMEQYTGFDDYDETLRDNMLPMISGAVIAEAGLTFDGFDLSLNYKYDFIAIPEYTPGGTLSVMFKYYF